MLNDNLSSKYNTNNNDGEDDDEGDDDLLKTRKCMLTIKNVFWRHAQKSSIP